MAEAASSCPYEKSDNNTIQNNYIIGANERAIRILGGDNNVIQDNFIGMNADGLVPAAV